MIVGNRNMHQTIALEGTGALVRLLAVSEDEELVRQVLTIISAVATTAAEALFHSAPQVHGIYGFLQILNSYLVYDPTESDRS